MNNKILHTFTHKFTIVLGNFLAVVLTSQALGSEGRGEISLFITDFTLLILFTGIVSGSAMSFYTPRKDIFTISTIAYIWSIPVALLGTGILHVLHPSEYSYWLLGAAIIQSFTSVHQMVLIGKNELLSYNLNTSIQPILNLIYVYFYFEILEIRKVEIFIEGYFYSSLIAYFVSIFQSFRFYTTAQLILFKETTLEMIRFGTGSYFSNIIQTFTYRASYYVLFWFGLSNAIGEMSNGVALAEATWMISNSLSLVLYAHILNTENEAEQQKQTLQFVKLCFILTSASLVALVLTPTDVFTWLFGKDFSDLKIYILLLSPGVLLIAISTIIAHYFAAKGHYRINNIKSILGFFSVILCLFLFIPLFGKKGAALATSISYSVSSFYLFYYYFKQTKTPISKLLEWADFKELWTKRKDITS